MSGVNSPGKIVKNRLPGINSLENGWEKGRAVLVIKM